MITGFYWFAWAVCGAVVRTVWRFRSVGAERVPPTGPLIVAANHRSYLDPVVLGVGLRRPVTYLAKKELFALPVLGRVITWLGAYPLDREAGGVAAVRAALRALKEGRCIGIFPEGTRNVRGDATEKGGAALLASLSGAPVVPAAIVGSDGAARLEQIRLAFGEPMRFTRRREADGDDLAKWTAEIMQQIRTLEESLR